MTKIDPTELQKILDEIGSTLQGHANQADPSKIRHQGSLRMLAKSDSATYQRTILTIGPEDELILTLMLS